MKENKHKGKYGFKFFLNTLVVVFVFFSPVFPEDNITAIDKQDPVKVDFNDVIEKNSYHSGNGKGSALKIAVAAMISPKYTYKYYINLLKFIGERMGKKVVFIQKQTYSEVNEMLKRKELNLAFVCSGPYVFGKKEFGMKILAVPVCNGKKVYYSYFIVSKESGIKSIKGLKEKTFAFTDPLSNTGYMVPVYYLARMNETPESFFKRTFFTHSHDNSIKAVSRDLADGAGVDSLIFDFIQSVNPILTRNIIIIEKSPPYGIPPVVVSPDIDPKIEKKLKSIFLSIHKTHKGKAILEKLRIDYFAEGNDNDYNTVRELQEFIRSKQLKK